MAASRARPKRHEREWAGFTGGQRHPSQGVAHEDLSGDSPHGWTAEHKTTKTLAGWLLKAFEQARVNAAKHPDRRPYVFVTYAPGQGIKARRFVMAEVSHGLDTWATVAPLIDTLATQASACEGGSH